MHIFPSGLIGCAVAAALVFMADEKMPMLLAAPLVVSGAAAALCLLPLLWERVAQ